jgi:hypothetical protein
MKSPTPTRPNYPDAPREMPIAPLHQMEYLVGRILTFLDVAKADDNLKSLIRQELWMWYDSLIGYTHILEKDPNAASPPVTSDRIVS